MRKLTVVANVSYVSRLSLLAKLAEVLSQQGVEWELWGWARESGVPEERHAYHRRVLLRTKRNQGLWLTANYIRWMAKVFVAAMRAPRTALFWAASFDSAFPLALASLLKRWQFVFHDPDNISKSYHWLGAAKKLLEGLEMFTARRSCIHILPSLARQLRPLPQDRILPNLPDRATLGRARSIAADRQYQRGPVFTLYVNGWLVERRGLSTLSDAVRRCPADSLNVLIAGKVDSQVRLSGPNVEDHGQLPPDEALALYYRSHLVFTFYDPSLEVNRLAEPNKWQDCIATQTPFVVNSEVVTARPFIEADACAHVSYGDPDALASVLLELAGNLERWKEMQRNLGQFEAGTWDDIGTELLNELPWEDR